MKRSRATLSATVKLRTLTVVGSMTTFNSLRSTPAKNVGIPQWCDLKVNKHHVEMLKCHFERALRQRNNSGSKAVLSVISRLLLFTVVS